MKRNNTGPIVGRRVCEYTGHVEIIRKLTMYDVAKQLEREAVQKKKDRNSCAPKERKDGDGDGPECSGQSDTESMRQVRLD